MPGIVDVHVHPPTRAWLQAAGGPYLRSAEAYFGRTFPAQGLEALVQQYEAWGIGRAVLLGWDAELGNGLPALPNDDIAAAVREHPSFFVGFAGVDPRRSKAVEELHRCARLGLRGVKLHPSAMDLRPDDLACVPFWHACEDLGLVAMVHTGTTGWGAGGPGGHGVRLIGAHAGWPWHEELLAIALHKPNVYLDVSGWLPKYLPKTVWDYANGPLKRKVLFGSDYPLVEPPRLLEGLRDVLKPEVLPLVLGANAAALLQA